MPWPPAIPVGALDAVAARALRFQRSTFLKMLQVHRALRPLDPEQKLAEATTLEVKAALEATADAIMEKHAPSLPDGCARAPGHLQVVSLALAAQRELLSAARSSDSFMATSPFAVRSVVADALGVVAPPDGTPPYAVPVQWVPNKIALAITGALWLPSRRESMAIRMMRNFEIDLGPAFALEELEPEPSRRLTRCFYRELLTQEGDDVLGPVFTEMHGASFAGVPGFDFASEADGTCTLRFSFEE